MPRAKSGLRRAGRPIAGQPVPPPAPVPAVTAATPSWVVPRGARSGPAGRYLATPGSRIGAYVVDSILVSLAVFGVWIALGTAAGMGPMASTESTLDAGTWRMLSMAISTGGSALYFILLWSGGRRTMGMRLFRMEVVRAADGAAVPISAAALRWAVIVVPDLLLGFIDLSSLGGGAGPLLDVAAAWGWTIVLLVSVLLSPGRQGFHDRAARTSVVTA